MSLKEYAEILRAIAGGKQIQWRMHEGVWCNANPELALVEIGQGKYPADRYRIKPDTITINGVEINAPMREIPKDGSKYWVPHLSDENYAFSSLWDDSGMDHIWLKRGLCFRTEADAIAASEAIIKALGGEV